MTETQLSQTEARLNSHEAVCAFPLMMKVKEQAEAQVDKPKED